MLKALVVALALTFAGAAQAAPVYQLRVYQLFEGNKAQFHARFRDQCIPIMKKYGFDIILISESNSTGRPEFVYLLRWPDVATKDAAWKAFLADPEWIAIKKETSAKYGPLVGEVADRALELTDYTPAASRVP
jgi:hypothetical protein